MKISYDKIADAMYLNLRKGKVSKTVEITDHLLADMDKEGNILGIEMLNVSAKKSVDNLKEIIKNGIPFNVTSGAPVAV